MSKLRTKCKANAPAGTGEDESKAPVGIRTEKKDDEQKTNSLGQPKSKKPKMKTSKKPKTTKSKNSKTSAKTMFWIVEEWHETPGNATPIQAFTSKRNAYLDVIIRILHHHTEYLHDTLVSVDMDEKEVIESPLVAPWKEELSQALAIEWSDQTPNRSDRIAQLFDRSKIDTLVCHDRIAFLRALTDDQVQSLYTLLHKPLNMLNDPWLSWSIDRVEVSNPFDYLTVWTDE